MDIYGQAKGQITQEKESGISEDFISDGQKYANIGAKKEHSV